MPVKQTINPVMTPEANAKTTVNTIPEICAFAAEGTTIIAINFLHFFAKA